MFAEGITVDPIFVYLAATLAGAGTVIAFLFRALITSKDRETAIALKDKDRLLAEVEAMKKSYQEIAAEAIRSAAETTNYYRRKEGLPPIVPVAPVIPESHSVPDAAQREAAEIQSMRARMAQIKLESGQEPRTVEGVGTDPKLVVLEKAVETAVERVNVVADVVTDMVAETKETEAKKESEG